MRGEIEGWWEGGECWLVRGVGGVGTWGGVVRQVAGRLGGRGVDDTREWKPRKGDAQRSVRPEMSARRPNQPQVRAQD